MEARLKHRLLGYFLALFLPSAAIVAGGGLLVYQALVERQVEMIELRETLDTQRGALELREFIADRARDVLFIRQLPSMRAVVADDSPAALAALERMFVAAIDSKSDVDRIRWIDETGRERVRVSARPGGPEVDTAARLQGQTGHAVPGMSELSQGQIYVSPMDLPSEQGRVEQPLKPVVRIGTPVFAPDGRLRGVLLVNYRVGPLLEAFDASTRGLFGHSMLITGDGHWLHVQRGPNDWGFVFGRKDSFAANEREAWGEISGRTGGQFTNASGLWTFDTVQTVGVAAEAARAAQVTAALDAAHEWKIVSVVPAEEIAAAVRPTFHTVLSSVLLLLAAGLAVSVVVARAWVRRESADLARAQQEARESEAGLRLVLQSNPNAMMVIDRDGTVFEANPQAERVFGYAPEEMRVLKVEDFLPSALRSMHVRYRAGYEGHARARPMGQGLDLAALRKDGSKFPVEISLAPLTLGGADYVVATVVDISARKQAEAQVRELTANLERRVESRTDELQRAESNLRLILESSANGLFGVDVTCRITFANPAACRMLDARPTDLIGRDAASLGTTDEPERGIAHHLERTLREGVVSHVEDEAYRRADGSEIAVMYSTHPMVRGGRIIGAVVSFIDATERRALDAAREAALREAERLAQARSDFLANMSHEIRTPLNGVLGLAQVAHRESDGGTRETFARILDAGRTLLAVVDNVLDFSRIEAGKVQVEAVTTDLKPLIDEVMTVVTPLAIGKGITLRVERSATSPASCVTDPTRVKQVLLNLLANALKFTAKGEVVLLIDRLDDRLRFVVRDTGIGIDREQAARIFSAFEQADTSTTRRFGGTGLGLAICKRITDLLGGEISVASEVGVGSEFIVELPFVEPAAGAVDPAPAHDPSISGSRRVARLAGLRILLAEDN
jgi:PAS domain S-box-containing protein